MDNSNKLLEIKQEISQIAEKLVNLFPTDHPRWNDIFEDIGAAAYYLEECNYRIEGARKTLLGDGETDSGG
ncbi:MAG: hypothetical protein V7K48_01755 [Nostoc sp.]